MPWSNCIVAGLVCAALTATSTATAEVATPLFHKNRYIMGTVFEIAVYEPSSDRATQAIEEALQEIVRLDDVMSNYKAESELGRLNRSAHFHAQVVSPDLYRVIEESLRYSRLSAGKFDVTVGPLVDRWKAALGGAPVPSSSERKKLRACVGFEKVELIPPNQIEFHSPCLRIDLGSIGKGYAVDRAVEILRKREIKSALVDAGGSTFYGMGTPPGQAGWLVHLRDPSHTIDPQVLLSENSVSTSEQSPRSLLGNEFAGHIIDPEDASPLRTSYALSVVAKTGTASDALSTTLLLVGPEKGRAMVEGLADAAAIWVSPEGRTEVATSGPRILTGGSSRGNTSGTDSPVKMFAAAD